MDSDANNLNSGERFHPADGIRVYTRRKRKTQEKNSKNDASPAAAAPETNLERSNGNDKNDVSKPISQTLEAEKAKSPVQPEEQRIQHQQDEAVPQMQDLLTGNFTLGDGHGGVELREGSCGGAVVANGGDGGQEVNGDAHGGVELREGSCGGEVVANGGDGGQDVNGDGHGDVALREGSCGEAVVANGGDSVQEVNGEVISGQPNRGEEQPRENHEVANGLVKPVISRVEDRVRISLTGATPIVAIRDLRSSLEGELNHVRGFVKKLEAKELQLTSRNSGNNSSTVAGGAIISHSCPQYTGRDNVINFRSLVRVNSEVGSVGRIQPRPFQPPKLAVAVNNHVVGEFVEREKRTPKANQYYKNSEFLLGKDRLPSESNKKLKTNRSGKKHRGVSKHGFLTEHSKQLFRSCTELLQRLMKHKHGWVFNEPVNAKALGLHDYHDIIKHPMDLGTVKTRLSEKWYKSPKEFAEDIRLVFSNAMTYNPEGQDVHVMAEELLQIFEERWAVIEAKYNPGWRYQMYHDAGLPTPTSRKAHHPPSFDHEPVPYHALRHAPQARTLERSESITGEADPKTKPSTFPHVGRTPVPKKPKAKDLNKRDMTYEEKQKLSTNLENLPPEKLDAVIQIIKKRSSALNQNNEEIEVDIDSVDAETLWELDRFVTNYKKSLSKSKRKAELALQARGRAALGAPVTSSGPMVQGASKKSRTGELHTSAPSIHVEGGRQAGNASSSSSSSSSSSDSGSSSSDSDSDSSSTCGSDAGH